MTRMRPAAGTVVALVIGVLGVAAVVAAAVMPWLEVPSGRVSGSGPSTVLLVLCVVAAVATLVAQRWPGWALLPLVVLLALTALAVLTTDPGWLCWDGVDENGNMVGGCEEDELTWAPGLLGAGSALLLLGSALAWVTQPAPPAAPPSSSTGRV